MLIVPVLLVMTACFNDNDDSRDYSEWRNLNTAYFDSLSILMEDGQFVYEQYTPAWDNSFKVLLKWHNDRTENSSFVTPLSNSTCYVKYTLTNISGDTLDSSASFKCVPNNMVTGFMAALMQMRVNDTITAVVPYSAGYGAYGYSTVLPYSTLTFGIRLDSISKLF